MTPEIIQRSFSNDAAIFDSVFFSNKYKIKGNKERTKVFVDLGSHAGYFSFLAMTLGAKKVYAFEPYVDNFNIMLKNCYTPNFIGKFTPYQLGINVEGSLGKFGAPQLVENLYFDLAGIGFSTDGETSYPCRCENLDHILLENCFDETIDVLKINIGYAEREILTSSNKLQEKVHSICGEITANDLQLFEFKRTLGIKGFVNFKSSEPDNNERIIFWASKGSLSDNFLE